MVFVRLGIEPALDITLNIGKGGSVFAGEKYRVGLISRAKSQTSVLKRQGSPTIDTETGENVWKTADNLTYVDKRTGQTKERTQRSTKMAEAKDVFELVSEANTPIERAYATYAKKLKALGNQARLEVVSTGKIPLLKLEICMQKLYNK